MVYKINHYIEFYIILKNKLNYFDIIPKLEELTKIRLYLDNNKLKILSLDNNNDRLYQSKYYLDNKSKWNIYERNRETFRKIPYDKLLDITLTDNEHEIITKIIDHESIKNNILDVGWYDVINY